MAQNNIFNNTINIDRFKAISDGVIAVAITLLVLDLKLPPHLKLHSSWDLWKAITWNDKNIFAYLISFWMIAKNWIAHYNTFDDVSKVNPAIIKLNAIFLLTVTFIPFPVSIISNYNLSLATIFFNIGLALPVIMLIVLNAYLAKHVNTFFSKCDATSVQQKKQFFYRNISLVSPIIFVAFISSLVCLYNNDWGIYCWALMFLSPKLSDHINSKINN